MHYSEQALFVLAAAHYTVAGRNAVSGKKSLSNADFQKLAAGGSFDVFKITCCRRISDVHDFCDFLEVVRFVLDTGGAPGRHLDPGLFAAFASLHQTADGLICAFDAAFPPISATVRKDSDKPYLLFYRGNVSLLHTLHNNVAVIGLRTPDAALAARIRVVVQRLVAAGQHIVSGLARGCDTIAHEACLQAGGKTLALLSTPPGQIYPAENAGLARAIVHNQGLLASEYLLPAADRHEAAARLVARDRLQAMFAKAVLLCAGHADSGSRHAMDRAGDYELFRAVLVSTHLLRQEGGLPS